jgi:hypothetical protein
MNMKTKTPKPPKVRPVSEILAQELARAEVTSQNLARHKISHPIVTTIDCHNGKLGSGDVWFNILWFLKCGYALHITLKSQTLVRAEYTIIRPNEGKSVVRGRTITLIRADWLKGTLAENFFYRYAEQSSYVDAVTRQVVLLDYCFAVEKRDNEIIYRLKVVKS